MNNKGFTVFEILIAITILSFMMFGIVSITTGSLDAKDRVLSEDKEMLQVESAYSILEWDFSQIYSPLFFSIRYIKQNDHNEESVEAMTERYGNNPNFDAPDKDGLPIPVITSESATELLFFTASNRRQVEDQKASYFAWVKYNVISTEKDDDNEFDTGKAFVRYFSSKNPFSDQKFDDEKLKPQILLRNIKELKFEYWHPEQKKFVSDLSSVPDGKTIIKGIKLSIVWIDNVGSEREEERVFKVNWPHFDPADDERELAKNKPKTTDPNLPDDPYGGDDD